MIPTDFKEYFQSAGKQVQQEIVNSLISMASQGDDFSEPGQKKPVSCPHCQSKKIRANGKLKGIQRFFCKACNKNFSETTGKFWYNIKKKDKMHKYLYCLLSGYSIRKSAIETGIAIQTSFDWRHKLLTSFAEVSVDGFKGIVESDELFFLHSEKGNRKLSRPPRKRGGNAKKAGTSDEQVAVIASCDRSGNKDFKLVTMGRISKRDIQKALGGKLEKADILCSDSHRSYTAFAKGVGIVHKKFNASKGQRVVDKVYHVQNVNNMDMRLRKFMKSFNGVSTKYLQNYLQWFLVLEKIKNSTQKITAIAAIAFASNTVWVDFKNIAIDNMLIRT
jgi:transposase-like protein